MQKVIETTFSVIELYFWCLVITFLILSADEANRFCTDSSESSNPTLLVSSSGTPQSFNGNPSSGHLSSDSGYYESSLCFGSRSSHGRFNSSIARNSAFVTSRSAGAESGLPTSKTGSSYSNEYGCGNSAFKSSVSSGSSGYGSSDSGYNSNNSSSSRSNASNLTLPQLSTLSENCLENVQNNSNVGPKERPQNTPKEKYPEYIDIAKRRASYKTWPSELHFLHPLDLADCGFFYSSMLFCTWFNGMGISKLRLVYLFISTERFDYFEIWSMSIWHHA